MSVLMTLGTTHRVLETFTMSDVPTLRLDKKPEIGERISENCHLDDLVTFANIPRDLTVVVYEHGVHCRRLTSKRREIRTAIFDHPQPCVVFRGASVLAVQLICSKLLSTFLHSYTGGAPLGTSTVMFSARILLHR